MEDDEIVEDDAMGGFDFFEAAATWLSARFLFAGGFGADFLGLGLDLTGLGRSLSASKSESAELESSDSGSCDASSGGSM